MGHWNLRYKLTLLFFAGFYAPWSHPQVPNNLTLLAQSLPTELSEQSSTEATIHGNRNRCPVQGTLYNMNTIESFHALDKKNLLKEEAKKVPLQIVLFLGVYCVVSL
jgi:hypothetical protein